MRGKLVIVYLQRTRLGITPAGAGKTGTCCRYRAAEQDHPRRCGENFCEPPTAFLAEGSPPQVRGKRRDLYNLPASAGITPAGAGKTAFGNSVSATGWDHPRRCGENTAIRTELCNMLGSPPQVRGKPFITAWARYKTRITPAGAGKTFRPCGGIASVMDHPRRCGENTLARKLMQKMLGSPPQVRGKQR